MAQILHSRQAVSGKMAPHPADEFRIVVGGGQDPGLFQSDRPDINKNIADCLTMYAQQDPCLRIRGAVAMLGMSWQHIGRREFKLSAPDGGSLLQALLFSAEGSDSPVEKFRPGPFPRPC
ncbi:hypothetical protein [Frankia sp. CiP3]|uniref:hypothetical protein n=1 Tax=Frankia sp. CiP3 TaxID=2880971 RepID=UPI001EF424F7|nr:hypothetical protein [Frankia sp. CiP3]